MTSIDTIMSMLTAWLMISGGVATGMLLYDFVRMQDKKMQKYLINSIYGKYGKFEWICFPFFIFMLIIGTLIIPYEICECLFTNSTGVFCP